MNSGIDDLLDMVDQWKFKVHERLKGLTPQQRRAFWSRALKAIIREWIRHRQSPTSAGPAAEWAASRSNKRSWPHGRQPEAIGVDHDSR